MVKTSSILLHLFQKVAFWILDVRRLDNETQEEYQSKQLITTLIFSGIFMLSNLIAILMSFQQVAPAFIESSHLIFTLSSWFYLRFVGKHFHPIFIIHILFTLLVPFFITMMFGGFFEAGGRMIWSLLCPIAIVIFYPFIYGWIALGVYIVALIFAITQPVEFPIHASIPIMTASWLTAINLSLMSSFLVFLFISYVKGLRKEKQKSERLLLNILPDEIALFLREDKIDSLIANYHEEVSILFADIVGFTDVSHKLSANDTVTMLNQVFCHFDQLAEKFGVEKIKTIGDCYMVASGVPVARDDHAKALVNLAVAMNQYIRSATLIHGIQLRLRIGIHSGPVVAGVIGEKKFVYDLWGNTVNIASRVESYGHAGEVTISGSTYELVKDDFTFLDSRTLMLRGVGEHTLHTVDCSLK